MISRRRPVHDGTVGNAADVGYDTRRPRRRTRHIPHIALATAHPAKFPDAIEAITGERPALPARLAPLMLAKERVTVLPNDLAAVQRFVAEFAHNRQGAAA